MTSIYFCGWVPAVKIIVTCFFNDLDSSVLLRYYPIPSSFEFQFGLMVAYFLRMNLNIYYKQKWKSGVLLNAMSVQQKWWY